MREPQPSELAAIPRRPGGWEPSWKPFPADSNGRPWTPKDSEFRSSGPDGQSWTPVDAAWRSMDQKVGCLSRPGRATQDPFFKQGFRVGSRACCPISAHRSIGGPNPLLLHTPKRDTGGMNETVVRARQRRQTLAAAMASLEEAASKPGVADQWVGGVERAIGELQQALVDHIEEVEDDEGLLVEILEAAPRLAGRVQSIKTEHVELLHRCDRLKETTSTSDPEMVRRRVLNLLGHLTRHRQHGADLVYEAYNVDISASD